MYMLHINFKNGHSAIYVAPNGITTDDKRIYFQTHSVDPDVPKRWCSFWLDDVRAYHVSKSTVQRITPSASLLGLAWRMKNYLFDVDPFNGNDGYELVDAILDQLQAGFYTDLIDYTIDLMDGEQDPEGLEIVSVLQSLA